MAKKKRETTPAPTIEVPRRPIVERWDLLRVRTFTMCNCFCPCILRVGQLAWRRVRRGDYKRWYCGVCADLIRSRPTSYGPEAWYYHKYPHACLAYVTPEDHGSWETYATDIKAYPYTGVYLCEQFNPTEETNATNPRASRSLKSANYFYLTDAILADRLAVPAPFDW